MNRRLFVQAGASSLFLGNAMIAASAEARSRVAWDYFFFDQRFAEARRLAGALSGTTEPMAVDGDVTAIWTGELGRASLTSPLTMQGVTTDSFYFCLKILLADQSSVETQVSRIGRDLHLWTIRTDNNSRKVATSWQNPSRLV